MVSILPGCDDTEGPVHRQAMVFTYFHPEGCLDALTSSSQHWECVRLG
jgi:hypothetical protein